MKFLIMAVAFFGYSICAIGGKNNNVETFLNKNDWSRADEKVATYLLEMYHETKDAEHAFLLHFENSQKMFNEIKKENTPSSSSFLSQLKTEKEEEKKNEIKKEIEENTENLNGNIENATISQTQNYKTKSSPNSFRTSSSSSTDSDSESDASSVSSPSISSPASVPRFIQTKAKGPVEEETIWRAIYATQLRRSPPTANVNVYSEENVEKEFQQAKLDAYTSEITRMKNQFEKNLNYMSKELERQKNIKDTLKEVLLLEEEIKNLQKNKKINKGGPIMRGANATKVIC